jgi:hypothetical protein
MNAFMHQALPTKLPSEAEMVSYNPAQFIGLVQTRGARAGRDHRAASSGHPRNLEPGGLAVHVNLPALQVNAAALSGPASRLERATAQVP